MTGEFGKIHVYTGNGKGKTTAALGLAFRASGHGYRTAIFCFMKGNIEYGEVKAAEKSDLIDLFQLGRETFVSKENPDPIDVKLAEDGLKTARKAIKSRRYNIIILDEINTAVDFGLVDIKDVLDLIDSRPENTEIICTGRYAPQELLDRADLVTEMKEIRHYYNDQGLHSRKGIEL